MATNLPIAAPITHRLAQESSSTLGWQQHSVDDAAQACSVLDAILDWYEALERPLRIDVAVFWRTKADGSSDYFFSPALCESWPTLPARYQAQRCAKPNCMDGAALLVGDVQAVRLIEGPTHSGSMYRSENPELRNATG